MQTQNPHEFHSLEFLSAQSVKQTEKHRLTINDAKVFLLKDFTPVLISALLESLGELWPIKHRFPGEVFVRSIKSDGM